MYGKIRKRKFVKEQIKNKGLHPEIFQLEDNEEIKETVKGDYWEKGLLQESRNSGEFAFYK